MFQGNTFLAGIEYIFISYGVVPLTWYFLYISFSSNKFVSKKNLHPMCGCDGNRIGKLGFFDQR